MNKSSKRIALEELRKVFDANYAVGDKLDTKLQNILTYSSAIITVASTIIISLSLDKIGDIFWILLFIVFGFYIYLYYLTMEGQNPGEYSFPISQDLDTLKEKYFNSSEDFALEQDIVDHLHYIDEAFNINLQKTHIFKDATKIMLFIFILLMLAITLGLLFPKPTLP